MNIKNMIGIIPARGGSKGLPRKNIRDLNGKPLISYTISAALACKSIDNVVVSSEDQEILKIATLCGANVIKRPAELATDTAAAELLIKHVLESEKEKGVAYRYAILLQPTSPLRNSSHIDEAIKKFVSQGATSLISVVEYDYTPFKCFTIDSNDTLNGLYNNVTPFMNRQNLPKCYLSNGAIYIFSAGEFLKNMSFYQEKCIPFIMSKEESIDIDTRKDLEAAEAVMKKLEG
jgi:CMP-N-acetylneuraminic acid synthetase